MARYLITGGAGFIGSNIVEHLVEKGEEVRVLDDLSTGRVENIMPFMDRIDWLQADLNDGGVCRRAVDGVDYILHQAAMASVPRSVKDPVKTSEVNVMGTITLLRAAMDAGVRRLVFASSSSVYGDQQAHKKVETLKPLPLSPYAAAKLSGENYCHAFTRSMGLETVSLRYFNVFGPRQDPNSKYSAVIPLFVNAIIADRQPVIYGDGTQTRDFTFVKNNVIANIRAATTGEDVAGKVYNIASGQSCSLLELLKVINTALGKEIEPVFAEPRVGDVRHSLADIDLAGQDLRYEVSVDFREGIERVVEWYLNARETRT